jgi:alpha-1,3-rhamnosyl/mannosyltransferase
MIGQSGWREEQYTHELEKNVNEGKVILPGYVPDAHVKVLLKNATTSIYIPQYEGFGLPLLESMACGIPVIASKIDSLLEIGGDTPFFCNPNDPRDIADSITDVVDSRDSLKERLNTGIDHAKQFTWDTAAKKIIKILSELAD